MYNPDYGFVQQGWECPKCHRIYSPDTASLLWHHHVLPAARIGSFL